MYTEIDKYKEDSFPLKFKAYYIRRQLNLGIKAWLSKESWIQIK